MPASDPPASTSATGATLAPPAPTATGSVSATPSPAPPAASEGEIRTLVLAFEAHDFGADTDFRAGLPSVIKALKGKGSSAAQIDEMIARAQWFYFTRLKNQPVPFETYLQCRTSETQSQPMKSPLVSKKPLSPPPIALPGASAPVPAAEDQPPSASAISSAEVRAAEAASVYGQPVATAAAGPGPAVSTEDMKFSDIVRLIAEGRADEVPVPVIPDGINDEPPSVSTMKARPKPWETAAATTSGDAAADAPQEGQV